MTKINNQSIDFELIINFSLHDCIKFRINIELDASVLITNPNDFTPESCWFVPAMQYVRLIILNKKQEKVFYLY